MSKLFNRLFRKKINGVYMKGLMDGKDSLACQIVGQHLGSISGVTVYTEESGTYKLGVVESTPPTTTQ